MYGSCVAKSLIGYCPKVPTWEKILVTFSIILGIVVLVFVIFIISRYIKRDRTYSKI